MSFDARKTSVHYLFAELDREVKNSRRRTEIVERMQKDYASEFNPRPLFDGKNLLYSSKTFECLFWYHWLFGSLLTPFKAGKFPVQMSPKLVFTVTLTPVSNVNAR